MVQRPAMNGMCITLPRLRGHCGGRGGRKEGVRQSSEHHMGLALMSSQQLQLLTKASLDQDKTEQVWGEACAAALTATGVICITMRSAHQLSSGNWRGAHEALPLAEGLLVVKGCEGRGSFFFRGMAATKLPII